MLLCLYFSVFVYTVFLFPVRKHAPPNIVTSTPNMQPNYSSHTTTHIVHPSHIQEQTVARSSDVTIVKNVQNQQPVIEQHQKPHYTQIQNQQQHYIPNLIHNNSEASQHVINQSHIYVNAPTPMNVMPRHHGQQWVPESNQQNATGQHNHTNSQLPDHLSQQSPPQFHPGSAGHVPYSPSLGPSNYQNVEVIRQVQFQQQHHQQFHQQNVQQQRLGHSNQGDRNVQIVGRNKPVGTVAPNTHTTASTVHPRTLGRIRHGYSQKGINCMFFYTA